MHITTTMLKSAGFKHEEFPDGWFWVFKPTDAEERVKLSNILGYQETASSSSMTNNLPCDKAIITSGST